MAENLAGNIPHTGPMRWLDFVYSQPDGWIIGQQRIETDHPFLMHGQLPPSALIEYIAQTAAAGGAGMRAGIATDCPVSGMLMALRDVRFFAAARAGDMLVVRVRVTHRMGNMFRCDGQAYCRDALICEGCFSFIIHSGVKL